MKKQETKQRERQVAYYLQSMQALSAEMAVAMACIGANALTRLQESIARQEALCAELVTLAKFAYLQDLGPESTSQLGETSTALRQTNLEYAALLKHSGRSLALLSSLCNTHTGHVQEARGARSKYQTWSCEM